MEINPCWANYFDNAATTPLDPRVLEAMLPYLGDEFGNAHSIHQWGSRAMAAVEKARMQVATLIGADDPSQIAFTSGATEANNWLFGFSNTLRPDGSPILEEPWISPFEHSSIFELQLRHFGMSVLDNRGVLLLDPGTPCDAVSCMWVNNETGTIFSVLSFRQNQESWFKLHSDITQAIGKVDCDVKGLDYASMSSHKIYGPKGAGALFTRDDWLEPLLLGGDQESGHRAGTTNVSGIVGFGAAAEIANEEREGAYEHAKRCQFTLRDELDNVRDLRVNGGEIRSPFILSVSFLDVEGESLVVEADNAGFAISAGAACSSRSTEPSHVLTALGLKPEWIRGTVRVSFGRFNTVEAAAKLGKTLANAVERLRSLRS